MKIFSVEIEQFHVKIGTFANKIEVFVVIEIYLQRLDVMFSVQVKFYIFVIEI